MSPNFIHHAAVMTATGTSSPFAGKTGPGQRGAPVPDVWQQLLQASQMSGKDFENANLAPVL
jgi:hypothetical protein